MDKKETIDVEMSDELHKNRKVETPTNEKPAEGNNNDGTERNQGIGILNSSLIDGCGVSGEDRENTTRDSRCLSSVLEYANKIRAFVGLEDDSLTPLSTPEAIVDEPGDHLLKNENDCVDMENLLMREELCDVQASEPDVRLLDVKNPLRDGLSDIEASGPDVRLLGVEDSSKDKLCDVQVSEPDVCLPDKGNSLKDELCGVEASGPDVKLVDRENSLRDEMCEVQVSEPGERVLDVENSLRDELCDIDASEPDVSFLDNAILPRKEENVIEAHSATALSAKAEIEKEIDTVGLIEDIKNQGQEQSSNSNGENNLAFVNEKDEGVGFFHNESGGVSTNNDKTNDNNNEQVPSMAALRRLSAEIVSRVLDSAENQLTGMIGDSEKSNTKINEMNNCVRDSENIMLNLEKHVNSQEIEKNVSKAIGNIASSKDNNTSKLVNEINLKDVLSKTYDSKDFMNKIELEMNKFDPSYDEDPDTICGIGSFKPQWLQKWATARVYLVVYAIIGILSGSYYTYFIGTISTLEKRFAFKSKISGTIMMLDEITPLLLGMLVGYFGGKVHRPRMVGISMLMAACSCFVSALPYFIYGPATHLNVINVKNTTQLEMCESSARVEDCDSDGRPPTLAAILFLMLASFLKGFGNLAYYAVGLAYMDDNAKKKNTPIYLAVVFALRVLGPMLGYLMSSAFLKYPENPFADPGYGPDDPRWIGGWWIGFVLQGVLLTIVSTPMLLFPRKLPGRKLVRQGSKESVQSGLFSNISGMFVALKRLAKNPLYIFIVLNTIFAIFGTFGHYIMLPKYMENQFKLTASEASLFSGPPGLAALIVATLIGGYLIYRFKPNAKVLTAGMCISEVISVIGYLILMIPQCENVEMTNYGWNGEALILESDCNTNCYCTTKQFTPVCALDGKTLYFSPCYAGCQERENETFTNCSCLDNSNGTQIDHVTKGFGHQEGCWSSALAFITILPILQFLTSLMRVSHTMVLLRSIKPEDKSVALGAFEALLSTFAFIPFPIFFGTIVDSACLVWEESCGQTGNCWFYDVPKFNYLLHGASASFSGLSVICLFVIFCLSGRVNDLYNDDEDDETDRTQKVVNQNQQDEKHSVTKF